MNRGGFFFQVSVFVIIFIFYANDLDCSTYQNIVKHLLFIHLNLNLN